MKNQKEEFFELIYAQYAKKLERICLRYVNYQPEYREIAADSVQKTFLKALEEYDRLKDVSYIEPWLYQMLRRALLVTPRAFCVTLQNLLNMQKAARFMQRAAFSFMRFFTPFQASDCRSSPPFHRRDRTVPCSPSL